MIFGRGLAARGTQQQYGFVLAILASLCIAWYVLTPSMILVRPPIPATKWADLPIRVLALALIIWQRYREGNRRIWWFDGWLAFLFAMPFISMVVASVVVGRTFGWKDLNIVLGPLVTPICIYYVIVECRLRLGFNARLSALGVTLLFFASTIIGLLQYFNFPGIRSTTEKIFNYAYISTQLAGPSGPDQSRGIFDHANNFGLACNCLAALSLIFLPKYKGFVAACWTMAAIGIFTSGSRNAMLCFAIMLMAVPWLLVLQGRRDLGIRAGLTALAVGFVGLAGLVSFGPERFRAAVDPKAALAAGTNKNLSGVRYRQRAVERALKLVADRNPVTGLGPAGRMYSPRVKVENNLSLKGVLNSQYALYAYQFGFMGLVNLVFLFYGTIRWTRSRDPDYTKLAFGSAGILFLIGSIGENTLNDDAFMTTLCLTAGLAAPLSQQRHVMRAIYAEAGRRALRGVGRTPVVREPVPAGGNVVHEAKP